MSVESCGCAIDAEIKAPVIKQQRAELQVTDLIQVFNACFNRSENTRLVSALECGEREPIYLPAGLRSECDDSEAKDHHRVIFAHGFYESALHEISHWCIAGSARRQLVDFGYWYEPDGRSVEMQREFEKVEIKPQAVEWLLSQACGRKFHISTDNLDGDWQEIERGRAEFGANVQAQAQKYFESGLPPRAEVLKDALLDYYQRQSYFHAGAFALPPI